MNNVKGGYQGIGDYTSRRYRGEDGQKITLRNLGKYNQKI